jgi:hypothetical protein
MLGVRTPRTVVRRVRTRSDTGPQLIIYKMLDNIGIYALLLAVGIRARTLKNFLELAWNRSAEAPHPGGGRGVPLARF